MPAQRLSTNLKANWIGFRGFGSNGHATDAAPPLNWNAIGGENILWKTPIAKQGMSSPVVWKRRIFLTGADEQAARSTVLTRRPAGCFGSTPSPAFLDSPADGRLPEVLDETGFAAPTVATNGRFVAAVFATGELVCVNMNGERVWAKHLGTPNNHYGHTSSLISDGDLLFVQYDQKKDCETPCI